MPRKPQTRKATRRPNTQKAIATKQNKSTWRKLADATIKYAPLAVQVAKMAAQINTEKKYFDTTQNGTVIPATGTMYAVTAIDEGQTQNTRIGISQLNDTYFIRGYLSQPPTYDNSTSDPIYVREILFIWNDNFQQNPINVANLTKLFEDPALPLTSPLDIEGSKSFSIIRDKTHWLSIARPVVDIEEFININPLHSKYDGPLDTDITFSHIFHLFISNQTVAGQQPTLQSYERLRYYDN